MFITNQLWPKPWDEPEKPVILKTHRYYMEKDDPFNSEYHSSARMGKWWVTPRSNYENQLKAEREEAARRYEKHPELQSKESYDRLHQRKFERNLLQTKSSQPQLSSLDQEACPTTNIYEYAAENPPNVAPRTARTRAISRSESAMGLTENHRFMHKDKLRRDLQSAAQIHRKISAEQTRDQQLKEWLVRNREKMRATFQFRRIENAHLEKKTGVRKQPSNRQSTKASGRFAKLSQPKPKFESYDPYLHSEYNGLLLPSVGNQTARTSNFHETARSSVRDFNAPTSTDSQSSLVPAPTEKGEIPVPSTKSQLLNQLRELRDVNDVENSLKEMDRFHTRHGMRRGMVGSPRIFLDQLGIKH